MDRGDGYEAGLARRLPRPNASSEVTEDLYPVEQQQGPDPYAIESSFRQSMLVPPRSWNPTPVQSASQTTLGQDPYSYEPFIPPEEKAPAREDAAGFPFDRDFSAPKGIVIQSVWGRYFLSWFVLFLAICFFVFTVIFAWNATGGAKANTRFLFKDPGRTILVLQICSTVSTTLFAEVIIASCEMVLLLSCRI